MDTATAKCSFSDSLRFPFARDRSRPLDPPPEFGLFRRERPVSQVTLWDGSKVWLVTRYDDAQQVLGDVRFSSVPSQPGYPLISPAVPSKLEVPIHLNASSVVVLVFASMALR